MVFREGYPVTSNHAGATQKAIEIAKDVAGEGRVNASVKPVLGGEDFAYMLEARPGAYIFMGNGDTAGLHHPAYDFNDEATPHGASYWARLVEKLMPAA
jgi:hippurate hydrolase